MSEPMTADDLDAIRARVEAATEGPWEAFATTVAARVDTGCRGGCSGLPGVHETACGWEDVAGAADRDATFIAHARTDVPALLAEVERLRAGIEALADEWEAGQAANREAFSKSVWLPYDPPGPAHLRALLTRPAPTVDAEAVGPTFTERQAAAWPEAVARVNLHDAYAPEDPTAYGWTLNWHEEIRPGRGHYLDAQFNDGEHFAQITMDVYGSPVVSVATLDWLHSDGNEDCDCDPCQAEREADDDDSAGLTVTDEGVGS